MGIEFAHPWWLLLLLPSAYAMYWWYTDERRLDGVRKKTVAVLRSLIFLLVILAVAGTSLKAPIQKQQTVFVVDESKSVGSLKQAVQWIEQAVGQKTEQDGFAVVGVGEKPSVEYPLTLNGNAAVELNGVKNQNFTNLAAGLRLAGGLADTEFKTRVVLLSDGEQNIGDAVKEASYLKERGIRVDVVKLQREIGAEVLLKSASVPTTLYQGEKFALNAVLESTVTTTAQLRIYEDNHPIATVSVQVQKGETRLSLPLQADRPGFHRYRVEIQPAEDTEAVNNTVYAYGEVAGRPSVLIVEGKPGEAEWLRQSLDAGHFPYEIRQPQTMPSALEELRRYSAIVLANVSGTDLPASIQQQIEIAVRDFGVGLLMTGGEDSFGLGGYFNTPVEKALPVYMDLRNQREIPSLGLMLVIDRSGSMGVQKMELAKEAGRRAIAMLSAQDTVGVVAFDSAPWWVIEPTNVNDPKSLQDKISGINAGGGTDIYPALAEAFDRLQNVKAKRKHMILLTDGQSPNGDYDGLTAKMREKGITMSTVAVGTDADQNLLRSLAEKAKGRFYQTTDSQNVPQIFSKETAMAGKTFIQDQPFTPEIGQAADLRPLFAKGLPQINAQVATTAKETADVVLANPQGLPLLARWQYGLGRAAAWTSDAKGMWANQWAAWDGSSPFWNQLLTWLLPQYRTNAFDIRPTVAEGQGQFTVNLKQQVKDGAILKAEVIGPDLQRQEVQLLLRAPGQYAANFRADRPGTYMITVTEEQGGNVLASASTGIAVAYSPEYALPKDGDRVLQSIAQTGGGQVLTEPSAAYADNLPAKWKHRDISLLLLLLAACLWPMDVAFRRVSLPWERVRLWWASRFGGKVLQPAMAQTAGSLRRLRAKTVNATERRVGNRPPDWNDSSRLVHASPAAGEIQQSQAVPNPPAAQQEQPSTVSRLLEKKRKR
ncbi:VWA domain-containing protein [Effusibacillus pohliae]|uniref:VWA domain-containing protein n=1 Tax=Effusibacillus pohliae TaxID=232270 RepID=UPI000365BC08|nr:VWA domain-containing protein [Effusibacillus pohliae]